MKNKIVITSIKNRKAYLCDVIFNRDEQFRGREYLLNALQIFSTAFGRRERACEKRFIACEESLSAGGESFAAGGKCFAAGGESFAAGGESLAAGGES
ncbi:MAG: hypothetical protein LBH82_02360, partial [Bacteroidales bacterium]|nr:hypothetical protein [Bacteroidales bacterium]